ncbi:radical SAM protein [Polyangium sorediatum]|uniref:Radical SAM protein n=1 Tax=Polyangium sorediatum TaxID=889274 RepID=A0ABT6NHV4_9BACT|nr:radical SAM protein [Polyangium sorediatum]MDI1427885.1 radical SAM protein [Polyangium sorediatum]
MAAVLSLGSTCNNACVFCAQGERSASHEREAEGMDLAARLRVEPGDVVFVQGGEPTLTDDLPAVIRALDERGARRIVVQTNGRRLAYRAFARALREASSKLSLDVSLHGSTEPMHDYHTQTPGSFKQTALGVRHARAEGIEVGTTTVITRSNYRHLAEIVQLSRALGARAVHLARVSRFGRAARAADRIVAPEELVRPQLTRALAEASRLGMGWLAGERASHAEVRDLFAGLGEVEIPPAEGLGSSRTSPGAEVVASDKNFVDTSRLVRAKPPSVNRSIAWER